MRRIGLCAGICLAGILAAGEAGAGCGLNMCPVSDAPSGGGWRWDASASQTSFERRGVSGHYSSVTPRVEYRARHGWASGAYWPVIFLDDGKHRKTGMGNPVLYGERRALPFLRWGTQLELPLGDDKHGIAAEHGELLPYAGADAAAGSWNFSTRTGYRFSLSNSGRGHGSGDHDHGVLLVNPHEDREFVYRTGAERFWAPKDFRTGFYLDGQHALDGDSDGTGFLTGAFEVSLPFHRRLAWTLFLERPLTRPERFSWRTGAGAAARF
ncbi:MAG: hypothetical protein ACT4O3_00015 [Elusimicrobiota bacterium]